MSCFIPQTTLGGNRSPKISSWRRDWSSLCLQMQSAILIQYTCQIHCSIRWSIFSRSDSYPSCLCAEEKTVHKQPWLCKWESKKTARTELHNTTPATLPLYILTHVEWSDTMIAIKQLTSAILPCQLEIEISYLLKRNISNLSPELLTHPFN